MYFIIKYDYCFSSENVYTNTLFILHLGKLSFRVPSSREEIFVSSIDSSTSLSRTQMK